MVSADWRRASASAASLRHRTATSRIISEFPGPNEIAMRLHVSARARISSGDIPAVLGKTIAPPLTNAGGSARSPHSARSARFYLADRCSETIGWAEATAEPVFLTRLLDAQAERCPPFRVFFALTFSDAFAADHPNITVTALGGASAGRRFFAGRADNRHSGQYFRC